MAFTDAVDDELQAFDFDGTDWVRVGNSFITTSSIVHPRVEALNSTDVMHWTDTGADRAVKTIRFDGTDWTLIGNEKEVDFLSGARLSTVHGDVIALAGAEPVLTTYKFDGTDYALADMYQTLFGSSAMCELGTSRLLTRRDSGSFTTATYDISAAGLITEIPGRRDDGGENGKAVAGLSTTTYATIADGSGIQTRSFDGVDNTTHVDVGNEYSTGGLLNPVMAILTPTRLMITNVVDNTTFQAYDLIGGIWTKVGNETQYRSSTSSNVEIDRLTDSRIVISEQNKDELQIWEFDGTDWAQFGTLYDFGKVVFPEIATLTDTRIAFVDEDSDELQAYDFNGTSWSPVGSVYNIPGLVVNSAAMDRLSDTRVAFSNSATGTDENILVILEFDGNTWTEVESFTQPHTNDDHYLIGLGENKFLTLRKGTNDFYHLYANG